MTLSPTLRRRLHCCASRKTSESGIATAARVDHRARWIDASSRALHDPGEYQQHVAFHGQIGFDPWRKAETDLPHEGGVPKKSKRCHGKTSQELLRTSFHAAERKKLEQLTHPELLREVWRELAITVGMTCRAMQRQLPTLITKPKELAILIKE